MMKIRIKIPTCVYNITFHNTKFLYGSRISVPSSRFSFFSFRPLFFYPILCLYVHIIVISRNISHEAFFVKKAGARNAHILNKWKLHSRIARRNVSTRDGLLQPPFSNGVIRHASEAFRDIRCLTKVSVKNRTRFYKLTICQKSDYISVSLCFKILKNIPTHWYFAQSYLV